MVNMHLFCNWREKSWWTPLSQIRWGEQVTEEVKEQGIQNKERRKREKVELSGQRRRGPMPEQLWGTILLVSSMRTTHCRAALGVAWHWDHLLGGGIDSNPWMVVWDWVGTKRPTLHWGTWKPGQAQRGNQTPQKGSFRPESQKLRSRVNPGLNRSTCPLCGHRQISWLLESIVSLSVKWE